MKMTVHRLGQYIMYYHINDTIIDTWTIHTVLPHDTWTMHDVLPHVYILGQYVVYYHMNESIHTCTIRTV